VKKIKLLAAFLALIMLYSGLLTAQQTKKDKEIYEKAKKSIYQKDWDAAIKGFEAIVEEFKNSSYQDDSLYWLGYSLDIVSRSIAELEPQLELKEKALDHLNTLIEGYSLSSWADDARVLRVKIAEELVKKGLPKYRAYINGSLIGALEGLERLKELKGVEGLEELSELYEQESFEALEELEVNLDLKADILLKNEIDPEMELKLIALDALLGMDEEKAFPLLSKIAKQGESPELRVKALFVLSQSENPKVRQLLIELATKDSSEKVREQALFWLSQRKDEESITALIRIYDKEKDSKLKEKLIFSLSQNRSKKALDKLMDIVKNEQDKKARDQAMFFLGQRGDKEILKTLTDLYKKTDDIKFKNKLIHSISQNKSDGEESRTKKATCLLAWSIKKRKSFEIS